MKTSSVHSSFTGLALKSVGLIMIVSALLEYIILAIPSPGVDLKDPTLWRQWQLEFTTQIVDRGIIPMVGVALLLTGYWVANNFGGSRTEPNASGGYLKTGVLLLSSFLGLIFLLLVPLHFNNVRVQANQRLQQIEQQATQQETQLDAQAKQLGTLVKAPEQIEQVEQRIDQQLQQAIESGQVPPQQIAQAEAFKKQLQAIKENPEALNQQVEARQTQIRTSKLEEEKRVTTNLWKSGIRTGLSSLFLAIGYIVIGWTGLRSLSS
ncbi:hormogonium polysaccharide biosynthesis protein HpsJ [Lyngbya aestuarii]|uniref:hormogonium polysaccharide biosynthesis protein HpsJ n=1 Tax=Lyngbya aestuarii TaxID=118322 RepID=UPI00403E0184